MLSPDSVDPKSVCDWELNEAERLSKRIIPVVCRTVPDTDVPGRLRRLNYVFMTPERTHATELAKLIDGLKVDIRWIRQHTDIGEAAERWSDAAKGGDHDLLRGKALDAAELWISSRPTDAPEPTETQRAFIKASREAEIARADKERRQIKRTRWFQRAVGILLLIGLGGVIWQDIETTKREQAVFQSPAKQALTDQRYQRAIRYALAALPPRGSLPWQPNSSALRDIVANAALHNRSELVLRGHTGVVNSATFTNDGKIVTSSNDGTARIFNSTDGRQLSELSGHQGAVAAAALSPNGDRVVTSSEDGTSRVWETSTGRMLAELRGHRDKVGSAQFSSDGQRIVTASQDDDARVWDAITGVLLFVLAGHTDDVWSANYSPDGTLIVTASSDKSAKLWDAQSGTYLRSFRGHEEAVVAASFSHSGSQILTFSLDRTARLWDTVTGQSSATLGGHTEPISQARFSPDGSRIVTTAFDGYGKIWNGQTGELLASLVGLGCVKTLRGGVSRTL